MDKLEIKIRYPHSKNKDIWGYAAMSKVLKNYYLDNGVNYVLQDLISFGQWSIESFAEELGIKIEVIKSTVEEISEPAAAVDVKFEIKIGGV